MKPEKQTPTALKRKCWKLMSEYIRRKHSDDNGDCRCFTCGSQKHWTEIQAGHGIGGRGNFILFLEEVIKPQCAYCNVLLNGRYEVFAPKLIDLYTREQYEEWEREARKPFKRSKSDYVALVYELQGYLEELNNG